MKLYRYRSITSNNLDRTFKHCEIYFSSPAQFNDPFDCKPPFSTNAYTREDLILHYRNAFLSRCPGISNSQLSRIVERSVDSIVDDKAFESSIVRPLFNAFDENNKLGVLCLSEVPDDILMWSHYSDGHKGIVLQFDQGLLAPVFNYCKQIDYTNNIIKLKDINDAIPHPDELAKLLLLKKSDRWKYEKEWRIIVDPALNPIPGCRIYRFPKEALTGVIFGCEMKPEDKYTVNEWLKEGHHQAQVYQAIRDINRYSISIDPPLN